MASSLAAPTLAAERLELAHLTRRGLGMPIAGMFYWLAVAAVLRALPQQQALVAAFALTGAVFPVGALLTRMLGGNLFAKSATLTPLALQLAAVQLFYWPVIIVVFRNAPQWTPFCLAILFGSHFLPYAWLYQSRGYFVLAVATAVLLSVAVLVTGGPMYATVPLLAAACYGVACVLLWREARPRVR